MTQTPTDALRLVPVEPTPEMMNAAWVVFRNSSWHDLTPSDIDRSVGTGAFREAWRTMLNAAPASPLPGGGPYERWSILNHLGESWTPENFDTERQATAFLDRWKRDNPKMDLSKHKVIPVLVTMTAAKERETQ